MATPPSFSLDIGNLRELKPSGSIRVVGTEPIHSIYCLLAIAAWTNLDKSAVAMLNSLVRAIPAGLMAPPLASHFKAPSEKVDASLLIYNKALEYIAAIQGQR